MCVFFFAAGVGDLGGGAQGGTWFFFENNGHGSWLIYTGSNFVFCFQKKRNTPFVQSQFSNMQASLSCARFASFCPGQLQKAGPV